MMTSPGGGVYRGGAINPSRAGRRAVETRTILVFRCGWIEVDHREWTVQRDTGRDSAVLLDLPEGSELGG